MRQFAIVILVAAGMIFGASLAKAAAQGGSGEQITVSNNGQAASGVSVVFDLSNMGKASTTTGTTTGTTDSTGSTSSVLDLSNMGKVQVDVYVDVCQNGQKVLFVNSGATPPPPDDGTCHRRKLGAFWLTGSDKINIDIGTGMVTGLEPVTPQTTNSIGTPSHTFQRWQVTGGFSYFRDIGSSENYAGFDSSVLYKPTSMIGFGFDASYVRLFGDGDYSGSLGFYNGIFEAGCQHGRFTPFLDAQFGVVHSTNSYPSYTITGSGGSEGTGTTTVPGSSSSSNAFDMKIGGGLDRDIGSHFAWRVGQVDWVLSRFSDQTQNNIAVSGGISVGF